MYPISSRLRSDHTVETQNFPFVVLTVVAVVAFLPHGPFTLFSSGVCLFWHQLQVEISSSRAGIGETLVFVVQADGVVSIY